MRTKLIAIPALMAVLSFLASCGAVKDKAAEVKNALELKGHWLMTQSDHSSQIEKAVENESMALTFKDGKMAFSPTDSVKGRAVYSLLSNCTVGPRPYHTENNQIVLDAVTGCPEKHLTVQKLGDGSLKIPDPDNNDIVRVFQSIDQAKFEVLVKGSDRKL